jgi:DNA-binding ferritin-like protein
VPTLSRLPSKNHVAVGLLTRRLADCVELQMLIRQAKWNLKPSSIGLSRGLNEIETDLGDYAALLGERAVQLGWVADHAVKLVVMPSTAAETQPALAPGAEHGGSLVDAMAAVARRMRDGIAETDRLEDAESAGMLAEVSRVADTWLWCLDEAQQAEVAGRTLQASGSSGVKRQRTSHKEISR